jgi:hypothetical protein
LVILAACGPGVRPVDADVPAAVEWIAVIELEDGVPASTSPLMRFDGPLFFDRPDRERVLVGYDRPRLLDAGGRLPERLEVDPVKIAAPCAPKLPAPIWAARLGDGLEPVDPATAPALTSKWIEERCDPPDELFADVRCGVPRCASETRAISPCERHLATTGCGLGTVVVSYDGADPSCIELRGADRRCDRTRGDVLTCESPDILACEVEIVPGGNGRLPPIDLARLSIGALVPSPHPGAKDHALLSVPREFVDWGQAYDLLPLDEHLVVVAIAGDERERCPAGKDRRLVFVDPDAMTVSRTATAPDCLEVLAPEISGPGFVGGVRGARGEPSLARFTADGVMIDSTELPTAPNEDLVAAIVALDAHYAVVTQERDGNSYGATSLVTVDPELGVVETVELEDRLHVVAGLPPDQIIAWARRWPAGGDDLRILSIPGGAITDMAEQPVVDGFRGTHIAATRDRIILFAGDDHEIELYERSPLSPFLLLGPVGAPGFVFGSDRWSEALLILGGSGGAPATALVPELYFLDPNEARFLPGRIALEGIGPVSRVRTDAAGRAFALLPWDGEVVRVTLR